MTDLPTAPDSLPKYLGEGIPKRDEQTLEHICAFADALLEYLDGEYMIWTKLVVESDVSPPERVFVSIVNT